MARFTNSTARDAGMATTPSSSPKIKSPGSILTPPALTGIFISPYPLGSPALGVMRRLKAGNLSFLISATSRIAPSITTPANFF